MTDLPAPLEQYYRAANAQNRADFMACFAEDAFVRDEGEGRRGHKAIAEWNDAAIKKYNCSYEVLKCELTSDGALVTAKVSGTFPNSPLNLTYVFVLENGLIKELGIQ